MKKFLFKGLIFIALVAAVAIGSSRLWYQDSSQTAGGGFYQNIQPVTNPDDSLVLVNKNHKLAADFSPRDLRLLSVFDHRNNANTTVQLRSEAADAVEALFQAAYDEGGHLLLARSGYRSFATQAEVHDRFVRQHGQEAADRFSARPGHSEHQTGLALDVTANSANGELVEWFSQTPEGSWLRDNAHRFGFIIRYPDDREADTGYTYEPWHIRFVGEGPAQTIFQNDWILEEYLENET